MRTVGLLRTVVDGNESLMKTCIRSHRLDDVEKKVFQFLLFMGSPQDIPVTLRGRAFKMSCLREWLQKMSHGRVCYPFRVRLPEDDIVPVQLVQ